MRKWEDLSEMEKEKLKSYMNFCVDFDIAYMGVMMLIYLFVGASIVLFCLSVLFNDNFILFVCSSSFLVITVALYFVAMWGNLRFKKKMILIFGFKDSKELFGIDSSDYKKIKIVRKELWEKVE